MEHKQFSLPAMRVSIVSVSRDQREHLKRLIEQHGPRVVGMSGFRDYNLPRDEQHPDVLLVDLDQADDASLTRIEGLLEQSNVPVLFNESTAVPAVPGPYHDDWVDNLVGKLYILATHRSLVARAGLSERPRYAQTVDYTLPNVLIVSHSKTRRRVLQIILAAQGIRDCTETSFEPKFIAERIEHYDALLVDEHNVSPDEQKILGELISQTQVPVHVCNSSAIPYSALARRKWGIQLAGKIIKSSKPNSAPTAIAAREPTQAPMAAPVNHSIAANAVNSEHEWGSRLSEVLAQVRTNLTQQAATAKVRRTAPPPLTIPKVAAATGGSATPTAKISKSSAPMAFDEQPSLISDASIMTQVDLRLAESKLNEAGATLGIISVHREMNASGKKIDAKLLDTPSTAQASKVVTPLRPTSKPAEAVHRNRTDKPAQSKKTTLSSLDLIDATNLDSLPVTLPPKMKNTKPSSTKPPEPLPDDARDSEIERFFDFDKEVDTSQSRHPPGEGRILNATIHDEILPWSNDEELTNPFSKHATKNATGQTQKKSRSLWRDSLHGIRKKLPKIFH